MAFDALAQICANRVSQGGSKSFVVVHGENCRRKTLGRYPALTLAKARIEAKKVQGEVLSVVPVGNGLQELSFNEARNRFLVDSRVRTKPKTFEEYDRFLRMHFAYKKQLSEITRQDIMGAVRVLSNKQSVEQHAFVARPRKIAAHKSLCHGLPCCFLVSRPIWRSLNRRKKLHKLGIEAFRILPETRV